MRLKDAAFFLKLQKMVALQGFWVAKNRAGRPDLCAPSSIFIWRDFETRISAVDPVGTAPTLTRVRAGCIQVLSATDRKWFPALLPQRHDARVARVISGHVMGMAAGKLPP